MKNIEISIIICTYNRANILAKTIISVLDQDYPDDKYEIIVVDDGSTDNTEKVVKNYPVKYLKNEQNRGIPYTRNKGLYSSNGEIIVYIDDDCIPETKNWLYELTKFHKNNISGAGAIDINSSFTENKNIIGVQGLIKGDNVNITSRYMNEIQYGNPPAVTAGNNQSFILNRLFIYFTRHLHSFNDKKEKYFEVNEIYGANCSFLKKDLIEINGYQEKMQTSEDTEICKRLSEKHKNKIFLLTKEACVIHKHYTSFIFYLKQTFSRSKNFLSLNLDNVKIPLLYPFPVLIALTLVILFFIDKFLIITGVFILPYIFYFWHLVNFFRKKSVYLLLFPYIDLFLETAYNSGIIAAYITNIFKSNRKNDK